MKHILMLLCIVAISLSSCIKSNYNVSSVDDQSYDRTDGTITGRVVWCDNDSLGVALVTVTLTGPQVKITTITDVSGSYSFSAVPPGTYTITPTKNVNVSNGVTFADASRIQRHVTGLEPLLGAYKRIAADVNKTNSINTSDASLISQYLAGNPTAAIVFNTSWRFVPKSYAFPNPLNPWGFPESVNVVVTSPSTYAVPDFVGIKLGDVDGSANRAN